MTEPVVTCLLTIEEQDNEEKEKEKDYNDQSTVYALPFPTNLRRNSISLPSGINVLEQLQALRLRHQMAAVAEDLEDDVDDDETNDSMSVCSVS